MKLELVSLQRFDPTEACYDERFSRREMIRSGCAGIGCLIIAPALFSSTVHAQSFALILAKYLFRNAALVSAEVDLAVRVSQEIRVWVKLINAGGTDRLHQTMTASLKGNDGSIESQERIAIGLDPGLVGTYHATAAANYPGTKHFDFRTEADRTGLSVKVVA